MLIKDQIYGEFHIEPVLQELINTREVQRLKGIHQGGACYLVNPRWNVTRYEHSVGVMLIIRLLGGCLEEQIAGLLHDISHTAFSHVVDFALDNIKEDYHEGIVARVIESSNIPNLLEKYGYDYRKIVYDEKSWGILEKPAPALCADRIDYTLRDMLHNGVVSSSEVNRFLDSLRVVNNEIVIASIEIAEWFVNIYYKEVIGFFMNPLNIYAYDGLSKALKIALSIGEITLEDLLGDDYYVFNLLKGSTSEEVNLLIKQLNYNVKAIEDDKNYDIYQLHKVRNIDPTVAVGNSLYRASEKSKPVEDMNREALEKARKGAYIKILRDK